MHPNLFRPQLLGQRLHLVHGRRLGLRVGMQSQRTLIVSFPVPLDAFNQHRSVSIIVQPYDQPLPITLTK